MTQKLALQLIRLYQSAISPIRAGLLPPLSILFQLCPRSSLNVWPGKRDLVGRAAYRTMPSARYQWIRPGPLARQVRPRRANVSPRGSARAPEEAERAPR